VHQALTGWLTEQRGVSLTARGAEEPAFGFHQRIFAAIAAHDADVAEAEMHAHLDAVAKFYWRQAKVSRHKTGPT
jgi:GntR family transcriptional regulator, sialic acid-inducible nan operon repressor